MAEGAQQANILWPRQPLVMLCKQVLSFRDWKTGWQSKTYRRRELASDKVQSKERVHLALHNAYAILVLAGLHGGGAKGLHAALIERVLPSIRSHMRTLRTEWTKHFKPLKEDIPFGGKNQN